MSSRHGDSFLDVSVSKLSLVSQSRSMKSIAAFKLSYTVSLPIFRSTGIYRKLLAEFRKCNNRRLLHFRNKQEPSTNGFASSIQVPLELYITVRLEHSHFSKISSSLCAVEMFKFFSVVFAEFYWTTFATTAKIIVSCSESINFEVYAHFLWKILTVDSTSSNTISSILRPSNKLIKNVRQVGSASNDCLDMESCLVLPRRHTRRRQS